MSHECSRGAAPPAQPSSPRSASPLAVGPPLLTLVNFEVENLVYMLVCLQWVVSGATRVHVCI